MPRDPRSEAIIRKQGLAYRKTRSDEDEYYTKLEGEKSKLKALFLALLEEDDEFREEVRELLKYKPR